MITIDEMIADAEAEEKAKIETIKEANIPEVQESIVKQPTVTISIEEYVDLRNTARDHARIVNIIIEEIAIEEIAIAEKANANNLTINNSQNILNAFKTLYPETYRNIEETLYFDSKTENK